MVCMYYLCINIMDLPISFRFFPCDGPLYLFLHTICIIFAKLEPQYCCGGSCRLALAITILMINVKRSILKFTLIFIVF